MKRSSAVAGPHALGMVTSLGAGSAILLLCLVFQIVVPIRPLPEVKYLDDTNENFRALILYAAAGGCHTLLCLSSFMFLLARLSGEEPRHEFTRIIRNIGISFTTIIAVVFVGCYFNLAVVQQSYDETVRPLLGDHRFGLLLSKIKIPFLGVRLEVLALIPLALIVLGILFSVVACFWAAHRAIDFINKASSMQKSEIVALKREIAQLMTLLSIIFTTSCVSTIAFLQLGRDWIEKGNARDAYIQNGYAMSIFWSACYTVIMLSIMLIPLFWAGRQTLRIRRQARYSGSKGGFYDPFYDVFSYGFISKSGVATLMPIVTSAVAAVVGS